MTQEGLIEGTATICNPLTNAQLLLYNRTTSAVDLITIPKSDTPTRISIQSQITGSRNMIEVRVRINPTEIGQYIYVDDFKLSLQ